MSRFGRTSVASPLSNPSESYDEIRSLIVRSFSPTVAIYAAQETDTLARAKGFQNGFMDLVKPYGERVSGKVVVRDSVGASRAWDDFGVRFTDLTQLTRDALAVPSKAILEQLEEVMERRLESLSDLTASDEAPSEVSPLYKHFLSRLLQTHLISTHETLRHPVCTVIAITSSTPQPIETLRTLYQQTAQGSAALPSYVNPEYLRYYVLVHDEDRGDFQKSSALFDQMKRHFGLHCHLLRLRSVPPSPSDDVEDVPKPEWLSPSEELSNLANNPDLIQLHEEEQHATFASDAAAIRTFIRELVAQSVVPHMEQRIALWNEQIASRRRGITGRFMSISRRWGGIGSSSRNAMSATNLTGSGTSGNYDSVQGLYRYDSPEALLRKLADYSFMLRDYKLAASTLELVRSDYTNDRAWKYLAGANEMCYVANLLNPLTGTASAKVRMETYDQMIETASYSYLTKCSEPALALRSIVLGMELLKVRGKVAAELAAKWAIKILDFNLVGSIGHVLISERVAGCFGSQIGVGNTSWGTRKRKAGLWNVMSADEWLKLAQAENAAERLDEAHESYAYARNGDSTKYFTELDQFLEQLSLAVRMKMGQGRDRGLSHTSELMQQEVDDEIVEDMNGLEKLHSPNRRTSLMTGSGLMDAPPRSPIRARADPLGLDDDFE